MNKPMEGITVIELANYVAGPVVGRMLADMGARVIKIEGRGGDAWRNTSASNTQTEWDENPLFDLFNIGKRSFSLNLKTEEGKAIFFKLLEKADILITNTDKARSRLRFFKRALPSSDLCYVDRIWLQRAGLQCSGL